MGTPAFRYRGNWPATSYYKASSRCKVGSVGQSLGDAAFPVRRFYYRIGPVTYESGDIFTLFTREREHKYIDTLVVYPQIWPLSELGLPPKEPFGEVKVRHSLFTDPIRTRGIRDYHSTGSLSGCSLESKRAAGPSADQGL